MMAAGSATRAQPLFAEARANLKLALPLIGAQLSGVGMGVTDTLFAGHISPQALSAVAVGANIETVPYVACTGLFMAVSAIVAQRRGQGRSPAAIGSFVAGLLPLSLWVGLLWGLSLWLLAPACIQPLHLSAHTQQLAIDYLRYYGLSGLGLAPMLLLRFGAEGMGATRVVMAISLFGMVANALLNWLLIYGLGPLPALGVIGSGLATALACILMALAYLACYCWYPLLKPLQLFRAPPQPAIADLLRVGTPIGITLLAEAGMFVAVSLMMARLGEQWVAAHQIALNVASVAFMVPLGLGLATTVRVGYFHGAGQGHAAGRAGWVGMGLAFCTAGFNAALMLSAGAAITGAYTADPLIAAQATQFLVYAAAFQICDGLQVTASGALRGLQDTGKPMLITLTAYWLCGLPAAVTFGFKADMGPSGLWLGLMLGLTAAAAGLAWRYARLTRNM